ncbi:hypothetical protein vBSdyM006_080 [Shigella phage vB_SdyM_006]|nr:hypothetical protein vBSdyM006_080 [Shigella phage vB_SdyM_006]
MSSIKLTDLNIGKKFYVGVSGQNKNVIEYEVVSHWNPSNRSISVLTNNLQVKTVCIDDLGFNGNKNVKAFNMYVDALKFSNTKCEPTMTLDDYEALSAHEKQKFIDSLQKDIPKLLNYCDMHDWYMYWDKEADKGTQRIGQAFVNWLHQNHLNVHNHYQKIVSHEPKLDIWEQKNPDDVYRFIYNFMVQK